jgi:hypothetical protein
MNLAQLLHEILELEVVFEALETRQTRGLTKLVKRGFKAIAEAKKILGGIE